MISVVVPTHNRAESAVRVARALDSQACAQPTEIIFVLDGCSDSTCEMLESLSLRTDVHVVETPGTGAAAARNRGVASAKGEILLFLDDDVIPQPGMLAAHATAQSRMERTAVIGPCPYPPEMPVNALDFQIRDWWRARYESLADPSHVFTYHDCLTGSLSIPRSEFEAVGGFDETFLKDGREDYEFGIRLLRSGAGMCFEPAALGFHYTTNTPMSVLQKSYRFGQADVNFVRKHPEVFHTLPLRNYRRKMGPGHALLRRLALSVVPSPKTVVVLLGKYFDKSLDRLWDRSALKLWHICRYYTYLLGARSAVGGFRRLDEFVSNCSGGSGRQYECRN